MAWRVILLGLAAACAVNAQVESLEANQEEKELAEVGALDKDVKNALDTKKQMWANFKRLADAYMRENKRLLHWNYKYSRDIEDGKMGVKFGAPIRYNKVPNFYLKSGAKPSKDLTTAEGCEIYCNQRVSCTSFSYNKQTNECLLSSRKLKYDQDSIMYLKKELGEDPKNSYQAIPGMVGEAAPVKSPKDARLTYEECKWKCTQARKECRAFIYNRRAQRCLNIGEGAAYDPAWTYNEKERSDTHEKEYAYQAKENGFKKKIFAAWKEQNIIAVRRETMTAKELKVKCKYDKGGAKIYDEMKAQIQSGIGARKAELEKSKEESSKLQDKVQKLQSLLFRAKTTLLDSSSSKELNKKKIMKITKGHTPQEVKKIYDDVDAAAEKEAAATSQTKELSFKTDAATKAAANLLDQRKMKESQMQDAQFQMQAMDARAVLAEDEYQNRCGAEAMAKLNAELQDAEYADEKEQGEAEASEKDAITKQKAAERANKAVAQDAGEEDKAELEVKAAEAGRAADEAAAKSKQETQKEVAKMSKKDKLEMSQKQQEDKNKAWKEKVWKARALLAELQKKEDANADAAFDKEFGKAPLAL